MKIGTKIIATNSVYKTNVPNGSVMTVMRVFDNNQIDARIDGGDGFEWFMAKGTFEEYVPKQTYSAIKDLNLNAGDVVGYEDASYLRWTFTPDGKLKGSRGTYLDGSYFSGGSRDNDCGFFVVSRATPDQVTPVTLDLPYGHATMPDGRTVDLTANRVCVDLMEPDKLQAMKDHGGPYERWHTDRGWVTQNASWIGWGTYRVAPKPVVRTEVMYAHVGQHSVFIDDTMSDPTHRLTLTIQDGDIIDTKTEKL